MGKASTPPTYAIDVSMAGMTEPLHISGWTEEHPDGGGLVTLVSYDTMNWLVHEWADLHPQYRAVSEVRDKLGFILYWAGDGQLRKAYVGCLIDERPDAYAITTIAKALGQPFKYQILNEGGTA